jgi:putative chitinase
MANSNFVSAADLQSLVGASSARLAFISRVLVGPNSNPTCQQKSTFLSQLAHESSRFLYGEEIGAEGYFNKYENRPDDLGNTQTGDGAKYRGRGFIRLTGRANYAKAGTKLGLDLVNNPEMAAFPTVSAKIAVLFWEYGTSVNLNSLADSSFYNYSIMTSKINGGLNGLSDRTQLLAKAISLFQCTSLLKGHGETCQIDNQDAVCKPLCVEGLVGKPFCGCNGETKAGLCQGPANIKCCLEKCGNDLDLTFVIDSSNSIAPQDFAKSKTLVHSIVSSLHIGEHKTRVAIINYSTTIKIEAYLNSTFDKSELLRKIQRLEQISSNTYTGEALFMCLEVYKAENGMRGMSEGVSKVVLLITDGASNGNVPPGQMAKLLEPMGVNVISIGVGSFINYEELNEIATPGRVLLVDSFQNVLDAFDDILSLLCSQPAKISELTSRISVEKEAYKYFVYSVGYEGNKDRLIVQLSETEGTLEVYGSLGNINPNDNEVINLKASFNSFILEIPSNATNKIDVYIGVKGLAGQNYFKVQISTFSSKMALIVVFILILTFFMVLIFFSIIFLRLF